jgi:hypothetical protein
MRTVRILLIFLLGVFLLDTLISCDEFDENCVTVCVKNSSSRQIEVSFPECMSGGVSISPGQTGAVSVLLGRIVWANGYSHVFRDAGETWEIF